EAALSALWRSAAGEPETRHAVLRSCALTLVVYVEGEAAGREAIDLIRGGMGEDPVQPIGVPAERAAAPGRTAARVAAPCAFSALDWARLTPWRELVAQCFDSVETRPYLDRLTEVQIEYEDLSNGARVQRGQSLLLAGWLASRLGWEPARESVEGGRIGQPFL